MIYREKRGGITLTLVISLLLHTLALYYTPINFNEIKEKDDAENLVLLEDIREKKTVKEEIKRGKVVDLIDDPETIFKKPNKSEYLSDKDRSILKETKAAISTNKILVQEADNNKTESTNKTRNENPDQLSQLSQNDIPSESDRLKDQKSMPLKLHPELSLPYDPNYFFEEEGPLTRLNTQASLYGSYFARVKRQISTHWEPVPAFNKIFTLNPINLPENIITSVEVVLDNNGRLLNLYVKKSSGFESWDNESVRSIRAASPFLNPPPALKDEEGRIKFDFSFIGEIGGKGFKRIIR